LNPTPIFGLLARVFSPFSLFLKLLTWAMIPITVIALLTLWNNRFSFWQDTVLLLDPIPFFSRFIFDVIIINFLSKVAQGIVCLYQGGVIQEFGITLGFGFLPYFYISKDEFWDLGRKQQLWVFGTPLIYRVGLVSSSILLWYGTRGTGSGLNVGGLSLFHAALIGLLMDGNPFWPSDGYGWLINLFRMPMTSLGRVVRVWGMMLERRPLPKVMTWRSRVGFVIYGLATVLFWMTFFTYAAILIAAYLERNFRGSGVLLFLGLLGLFIGWCWWVTQQFGVKATPSGKLGAAEDGMAIATTHANGTRSPTPFKSPEPSAIPPKQPRPRRSQPFRPWKWIRLLLLIGILIVLALPYQYHTGGDLKLLPPKKQEIVAQLDAFVQQSFYQGGDGSWIKAGTVIAQLEATDVENQLKTTQEAITGQQALLKKQQANLDKLLAGAKPEEIGVARQQVGVSQAELEIARSQLETLRVQADLSARRASRFTQLYDAGAISQQQLEDVERQAETDRTSQATAESTLRTAEQRLREAQANLALVKSAAFPQDIEAARQEIAATHAQIRQQQQQLRYLEDQIQRTQLVMPFDGRLITPYLDQKVGSFLKEGNVFAEAEDNRNMQGEVSIPEFQVNEISQTGEVEGKLLAYPEMPLIGHVVSIAPVASELSYGRVVKVLVEFPNPQGILKTDMTGYAKIKGSTMPVIVAFTRALIRFVLIEVWSWLP